MKPKKKEFIKEYIENGNNATKAVKDVFGIKDDNYAGVKGNRLLRNDKIQNAIKSIADQIPDSLLIEKHLALLNKEEVITKNNMTTGEIDIVSTGQIDPQAVKAGLDMAYKLKGNYAPEKRELSGVNGEPLFTDEQRTRSKSAVTQYLNRRNSK
jgi:phage terminase small subunit